MDRNEIGRQLGRLREANGITVSALVVDVISVQQYYRIIKGESSIAVGKLIVLLDRLNISVDMFFDLIAHEEDYQQSDMNILDLADRVFWTQKDVEYYLGHFQEATVDTNRVVFHNFVQIYRTELAFKTSHWDSLISLMIKMMIYALENNCQELIDATINLKDCYYVDKIYPMNVFITQIIQNQLELRAGQRTVTAEIAWAQEIVEYAKYVAVDTMIADARAYVAALEKTQLY